MLIIHHAGHRMNIPGWPTNDLEGIFAALERWDLEARLDMTGEPSIEPHPLRGPYRGPALRCAGQEWRPVRSDGTPGRVYLNGEPIYPDAPGAVHYMGNFEGYSFGWNLTTDEPELIARLDAAIAANIARRDAPKAAPF